MIYPDQFIPLVEGAMGECHDSVVRARLAAPEFQHLGLYVNCIAME